MSATYWRAPVAEQVGASVSRQLQGAVVSFNEATIAREVAEFVDAQWDDHPYMRFKRSLAWVDTHKYKVPRDKGFDIAYAFVDAQRDGWPLVAEGVEAVRRWADLEAKLLALVVVFETGGVRAAWMMLQEWKHDAG